MLLRMKRTHIHFATAQHHLRKNKWAEVFLRLDLQVRRSSKDACMNACCCGDVCVCVCGVGGRGGG